LEGPELKVEVVGDLAGAQAVEEVAGGAAEDEAATQSRGARRRLLKEHPHDERDRDGAAH
jgi:hypothetical protein